MKWQKLKILWWGSQCQLESPSSSSKKVAIPDCSQEGFRELDKGWHCSSWVKGFPGVQRFCTFGAKLQDMTDRQNTVTPASVLPSGKWIDAASME